MSTQEANTWRFADYNGAITWKSKDALESSAYGAPQDIDTRLKGDMTITYFADGTKESKNRVYQYTPHSREVNKEVLARLKHRTPVWTASGDYFLKDEKRFKRSGTYTISLDDVHKKPLLPGTRPGSIGLAYISGDPNEPVEMDIFQPLD